MMTNKIYIENVTKLYDVFYNSIAYNACEYENDKMYYMNKLNKIIVTCEKYNLHVIDVNDVDFEKSYIIYDCESFYIVNNDNEIVALIDNHFDYYNIVDCETFFDCETIYDKNNNEYCVCDEKIVYDIENYYNSLK